MGIGFGAICARCVALSALPFFVSGLFGRVCKTCQWRRTRYSEFYKRGTVIANSEPLKQKGFGTLKGLNSHLASPVHAQKSYHCPRCRREFTVLSGLINHLESESCGSWRFTRTNGGGLEFVKQLQIGM